MAIYCGGQFKEEYKGDLAVVVTCNESSTTGRKVFRTKDVTSGEFLTLTGIRSLDYPVLAAYLGVAPGVFIDDICYFIENNTGFNLATLEKKILSVNLSNRNGNLYPLYYGGRIKHEARGDSVVALALSNEGRSIHVTPVLSPGFHQLTGPRFALHYEVEVIYLGVDRAYFLARRDRIKSSHTSISQINSDVVLPAFINGR